ncbi:MAG: thermonuclease family protein [Chryseolinea sp.]
MKFVFSVFIAISFLSCQAVDKEGNVVKVIDGDTFDVLQGTERTRIRLFGIDSPERGQPFNKKAKAFTESLVSGKKVKVVVHNKDRYGRTVADVYLMDGTHVNAEIVGAGYAWQYKQYSIDPTIAALEAGARKEQKGLWGDDHAIPPWEFRHKKVTH